MKTGSDIFTSLSGKRGVFLIAALGTLLISLCVSCGATNIGLGSAGQYSIFALNQSSSFMDDNLTMVSGDMAIGPSSKALLQQGTVAGTLFVDPTNFPLSPTTVQVLNGAVVQQRNLSQAVTDAVNASAAFAALPTNRVDVTAITGSKTIVANPGDNVFNLTGGMNLANSLLVLQGTANDYLIFNLPSTAGIHFDNSNIATVGGITPGHILFNVTGSNPDDKITLANTGSFRGTILAPDRSILVSDLSVAGMLIGGRNALLSGSDGDTSGIRLESGAIVGCGLFTPQPIPEPMSLLAAIPLSSLALFLRKRR